MSLIATKWGAADTSPIPITLLWLQALLLELQTSPMSNDSWASASFVVHLIPPGPNSKYFLSTCPRGGCQDLKAVVSVTGGRGTEPGWGREV